MFIVIIHKRLPMKRSVHLQEVYFQVYSNMFEEVEIDGNFGCMTQDSFKKKKPCNSTGSLMNWLTVLGSLKLLLWWTCYIHKKKHGRSLMSFSFLSRIFIVCGWWTATWWNIRSHASWRFLWEERGLQSCPPLILQCGEAHLHVPTYASIERHDHLQTR